jgi:predicted nucleic acid-binding protein
VSGEKLVPTGGLGIDRIAVKYLVDSNILSEASRPVPDDRVVAWLRTNQRWIAVNPIILGELEYGILLLPSGAKRRSLEEWFARGCRHLRVVDFDADCAAAWARLLARLKKAGLAMPLKDSLIAATALAHHLTVATRNTRDFAHAGVPLVNPFDA